ncbi:MAG: hypothetical protein KAG62_13875 [Caulobacter sp.]|jgi:hypothetical protein|nr:hypothetical protein [Caulobacter sp.]
MGIRLENCVSEESGRDGFHFSGVTDVELKGCVARNSGRDDFHVEGPNELAAEMKTAANAGDSKEGLIAKYAEKAKVLGVSLEALAATVNGGHELVGAFLKAIGRG